MNFLRTCSEIARRVIGAGIAVGVLLLCAPLLDTLFEGHRRDPLPPVTQPAPRVAVTLQRGDTLLSVLMRHGLEPLSAHALIETIGPQINLRALRSGDDVQLVVDPNDKTVRGMELVLADNLLRVKATPDGWSAERQEIPFVRATRAIHGTITNNLYENGIAGGLTPQQIMDLARIFEYEIDFYSDFQRGDAFAAVIEEIRYADGRRNYGRIVAARLEADKRPVAAIYFVARDGNGGYYDEQGHPLRRAFLRAPLSYFRISSRFNLARRHPIFRTVRPHRAIDYAAPAGTPVVAVGRGRVEFAGWRGGYGKLVEIRHANHYSSRYGHFSRIAKGIRNGRKVEAGDVIGYVGETGHATGPHLHFEFLKRGEKINFLALQMPKLERLKGAELERFIHSRDEQLAVLQNGGQNIARADSSF